MTGVIIPCCACVAALKDLQNSIMLTPRCPKAGPTGGLGLACPAGICSLISPITFFAMAQSFQLIAFNLNELEFNRSRSSEYTDQDAQLALIGFDFFDDAVEIGKWTVDHLDVFTHREQYPWFRFDGPFFHLLGDRPDFLIGDRRWIRTAADETGHLRCFFYDVPGVVIQFHLNQNVPWKKFARGRFLFTLYQLYDFLDRHQYFSEKILLAERSDALLKGGLRLLFVS